MERNGHNAQVMSFPGASMRASTDPKAHKLQRISHHFRQIMEALGLDLQDPSLRDTPDRVAKMYLEEVFKGLDPGNFPKISLFENTYGYKEMILVRDISLYSYCEHHFVPFFGEVHVAYLPHTNVIGLSKLNRVVDFLASKPQIQEKLTTEIANTLCSLLGTRHVAVMVEATHLCVASRGIKDTSSRTKTAIYQGAFKKKRLQENFLRALEG